MKNFDLLPNAEEGTPAEELIQIWARRATQLTKPLQEVSSEAVLELTLVRVGQEIYGFEVAYVSEVRLLNYITRVPRAPRWVAGVVNLRGRIMSVLDLRAYLGLSNNREDTESNQPKSLVVVSIPNMELAFLIDEVLEVTVLPLSSILEANEALKGLKPEFVRGIAVHHTKNDGKEWNQSAENGSTSGNFSTIKFDGTIVVLNLQVLLSDPRLIVQEEVV